MANRARFVVGYALPAKKLPGIFSPDFVKTAESRGIEFVCIDSATPLEEQGPFDAILHKVYEQGWYAQLSRYQHLYPSLILIDPPASIERLHNRLSMLEAVKDLTMSGRAETVGVPLQFVLYKSEDISNMVTLEDLQFPVLAKPLLANGSVRSHSMSLVYSKEGLQQLEPPVVLQQFVNHGGVLFKVYVAGDCSKCVVRASLPDLSEHEPNKCGGLVSFNQISNKALDGSDLSLTELPSTTFISDLAKGLRKNLGLNLFNFDLIRDSKARNRYFVIDINYFPGFEKVPGYESMMAHFFYQIFGEKASTGD